MCDGETLSVDETWLKRDGQRSAPAMPFVATLVEREKEIIETVLAESHGQVAGRSGAAAKLGMPRQTLESKIKSLGIDRHRFKARQTTSAGLGANHKAARDGKAEKSIGESF